MGDLLWAPALMALAALAGPAAAQSAGGTLRIYHRDNLPSASLHEEATISTVAPFMSVFNNLVVSDQHQKLNTPETIVPDLAESWSWDARQPNSASSCVRALNGTTASPLPPGTSPAPGTN